jgi:high-affinity Fe2+/Pb2+ permease
MPSTIDRTTFIKGLAWLVASIAIGMWWGYVDAYYTVTDRNGDDSQIARAWIAVAVGTIVGVLTGVLLRFAFRKANAFETLLAVVLTALFVLLISTGYSRAH